MMTGRHGGQTEVVTAVLAPTDSLEALYSNRSAGAYTVIVAGKAAPSEWD